VTKCSQRHKLLFGIFKIRDKHNFIISNAFYTLENTEEVDIIKTCQDCGVKEALLLDKATLLEAVTRFPNAFNAALRGYLQTWMK
jgi:hypothetical protein